ncbi:MAG TPA: YebC/PmpR family DNA-binding transcriptional regulator [Candidatus Nitrosotenuis sp.]|nr:YebC/PmpR family DNA-binding transcriptional regulator [Candidatus Nitrosotenuis sp.]
MAGHSKWHNIKLRKARVDALKGKMFTKVSKEILMAVKAGGPDPEGNLRLKTAIARAREVNMPVSNIERLIERASGAGDTQNYEEITYEGYGPHGVAVLVEAATDNRNRTAAEVRTLFNRHGGSLGEAGCVAWVFDRRGLISVPARGVDEESLLMAALEAGALDMQKSDGTFDIYTEPAALHEVREKLEAQGFTTESAQITLLPRTTVELDETQAQAVLALLEALEDHDDVQNVYANFEISAEVLEAMSSGR